MEGFADYVARERERLQAERESLIQQRREIDQKLAGIDKEFGAVDAYEAAKAGKKVAAKATGGSGRGRGDPTRQPAGSFVGGDTREPGRIVARRDFAADGSERRQGGRNVRLECPDRVDEGQSGTPRRRQIPADCMRLGGPRYERCSTMKKEGGSMPPSLRCRL